MEYSNMALFVLSSILFNLNGINAISGKKDFSNYEFFKIAKSLDFNNFKNKCENILKNNVSEFYKFKDSLDIVLNNEYTDLENNSFKLNSMIIKELIKLYKNSDGFVCYFDKNFPKINPAVTKDTEKPFILFYKGDISLLNNLNQNIAVIGVLNPDESILDREKKVVRLLVQNGMNIVSGLAKGCDTAAHITCLEEFGKTIAILPSTLSQILPAENKNLAYDIVDNNGLLITEYFLPPKDKYEAIKRYINRDRLQAMFSKAIVLSASYNEKNLGDCGSRHAMIKAEEYAIYRGMIYNHKTDNTNNIFGLNKEYYENKKANVLTSESLNNMINFSINYEKQFIQKTLC